MTFGYHIDPTQHLLFVGAEGVLQPGDLFGLMRAIDSAPELSRNPGFSFLGDYRAADWSRYTPATLFGLAYFFGRLSSPCEPAPGTSIKQALVASGRNLAYVRELHGATALVGSRQRRFFMDCASARQWLGLPAEWQPPERVFDTQIALK